MLTLAPFTFCANNVPGTDPIRAMDMARRCGFLRSNCPPSMVSASRSSPSAVHRAMLHRLNGNFRSAICNAPRCRRTAT